MSLAPLLLGGAWGPALRVPGSVSVRLAAVIRSAYGPATAGSGCRHRLPAPMAPPEALEALPDLTLQQAAARWGVGSPNTIKARARALGVVLRRESPTRTVWPAADVPLGDRLAEHLKRPGATLASFPEALPAASAGTDGSEPEAVPIAAAGGGRQHRKRSGALALPAAGAGTDGLMALAQLAAAMAPPPPPADPLAVARGLSEAAELGAWLTVAELARLLGVAPGTVRGWGSGHRPRPGFELERRKDGGAVWWRVTAASD